MSQTVPLSNLLAHSNHVVESFHKRMQEDNMNHIDSMLSAYAHALEGGASPRSLNHMEKLIANRDNFNEYRMAKDATEWMAVDKKLHSYLGRNMNVLSGGQFELVPYTREPNLVQALRLENAYIESLAQKMMQSRSASLRELDNAVAVLNNDANVPQSVKVVLAHILRLAQEMYDAKLRRDAQDLMSLEVAAVENLAPGTSACITACGVKKAPAAPAAAAPSKVEELGGGCMKGGCSKSYSYSSLALGGGQNRMHEDNEWLEAVAEDWLEEEEDDDSLMGGANKPKFRSPAAAQLYNLISSN